MSNRKLLILENVWHLSFLSTKGRQKNFYTFKTLMKHSIKSLMFKLFTISGNITKCPSNELVARHRLEMMATFATIWQCFTFCSTAGLHKLWYPGIRDRSTWGKFGAHGEHGDVFPFSNLGALWFSENLIRYSLHVCLREVKNNLFSFKHSYLRHFSWRF